MSHSYSTQKESYKVNGFTLADLVSVITVGKENLETEPANTIIKSCPNAVVRQK